MNEFKLSTVGVLAWHGLVLSVGVYVGVMVEGNSKQAEACESIIGKRAVVESGTCYQRQKDGSLVPARLLIGGER